MALTDKSVRQARPEAKARRLWDERGLYLQVSPAGGKLWRFKYRFGGKEKLLAIGTYPDVTLREARAARDAARRSLLAGIDPSAAKKAARARRDGVSTVEAVARAWARSRDGTLDARSEAQNARRLEVHLFPRLGARPMREVTAADLREVILAVEAGGRGELARRVRVLLGQVWAYGIAHGHADHDVTSALKGVLAPIKSGHHAAVTEPAALGGVLRAIDGYPGEPSTCAALRLAPLLFVRPGELVGMRWADVDTNAAEWRYVASKTKTPHIVPLATQALAILDDMRPHTGHRELCFHSVRSASKRLSANTLGAALRYLGIDTRTVQSVHGFRSTARTMLEERLGFRPEVIELQLAHAVKGPLGAAYNRTTWLDERRAMMQRWADYLDELRSGNVVTLPVNVA